jgi:protein-S-isoprenylcysteine O-methyltransferase Ste14
LTQSTMVGADEVAHPDHQLVAHVVAALVLVDPQHLPQSGRPRAVVCLCVCLFVCLLAWLVVWLFVCLLTDVCVRLCV